MNVKQKHVLFSHYNLLVSAVYSALTHTLGVVLTIHWPILVACNACYLMDLEPLKLIISWWLIDSDTNNVRIVCVNHHEASIYHQHPSTNHHLAINFSNSHGLHQPWSDMEPFFFDDQHLELLNARDSMYGKFQWAKYFGPTFWVAMGTLVQWVFRRFPWFPMLRDICIVVRSGHQGMHRELLCPVCWRFLNSNNCRGLLYINWNHPTMFL